MSDQPTSPTSPEYQRLVWEHTRDEARRAHDLVAESGLAIQASAIKSSELALRTAVLINGGAAISVLAFIGGLASQGKIDISHLGGVADNLIPFAGGVASATVGMNLSYLTHYFNIGIHNSMKSSGEPPFFQPGPKTEWWARARRVAHILAIVAGIASLVLFVMGMFDVKDAIIAFSDPGRAQSEQEAFEVKAICVRVNIAKTGELTVSPMPAETPKP